MRTQVRPSFVSSIQFIFKSAIDSFIGKKVVYQCAITGEKIIHIGSPVVLVPAWKDPEHEVTIVMLPDDKITSYYLVSAIFSKIPTGHYPIGYWTEEGFKNQNPTKHDMEAIDRYHDFSYGSHTEAETLRLGFKHYVDIDERGV